MDNKRIAVIAASITLVIGAAWFFTPTTGLLTLPTDPQQTEKSQTNTQQENTTTALREAKTFFAGLSFEEVKPTKLNAAIEGKIVPCPAASEIKIKVKNIGENTAERLKNFFQGFRVKECENCNQRELHPGEETILKVQGCTEQENAFVQLWALNVEKETVYLH